MVATRRMRTRSCPYPTSRCAVQSVFCVRHKPTTRACMQHTTCTQGPIGTPGGGTHQRLPQRSRPVKFSASSVRARKHQPCYGNFGSTPGNTSSSPGAGHLPGHPTLLPCHKPSDTPTVPQATLSPSTAQSDPRANVASVPKTMLQFSDLSKLFAAACYMPTPCVPDA